MVLTQDNINWVYLWFSKKIELIINNIIEKNKSSFIRELHSVKNTITHNPSLLLLKL